MKIIQMKNIDLDLSINLKDFNTEKNTVLSLLKSAKRVGKFKRTEEIDNFFSQQPNYAYKYVKSILIDSCWDYTLNKRVYKNLEEARLSPENEKVLVKNIKYAVGYLRITDQKYFRDQKTQKSFENKVYKIPGASFDYAKYVLKGRIPEEKENIFLKDFEHLWYYSCDVLKGFFPDSIHKKLMLCTFNNNDPDKTYLDLYFKGNFEAYSHSYYHY